MASVLPFGHFGQAHWFKMSVLDKDDRQTALTQSQWSPIELSIYSWAVGVCVCVCVCARARVQAQSCPTLWDPMDCSPLSSSVHGIFSSKNTRVGCHFLLQGIFPTQGSNPCLLNWQMGSLPLTHEEGPKEIILKNYQKLWKQK